MILVLNGICLRAYCIVLRTSDQQQDWNSASRLRLGIMIYVLCLTSRRLTYDIIIHVLLPYQGHLIGVLGPLAKAASCVFWILVSLLPSPVLTHLTNFVSLSFWIFGPRALPELPTRHSMVRGLNATSGCACFTCCTQAVQHG
jgi:hypothetical protein